MITYNAKLICCNDLVHSPPGRTGLFGPLVAVLGVMQPVPKLSFDPRALGQQFA